MEMQFQEPESIVECLRLFCGTGGRGWERQERKGNTLRLSTEGGGDKRKGHGGSKE
jgi:hypothetical protein